MKNNTVLKLLSIFITTGVVLGVLYFFNSGKIMYSFPKAAGVVNLYYVSPSGLDTNSGGKNSPFKTIAHAINVSNAGDEIRVGSGVYKEHIKISGKNGTSDSPIRIIGDTDNPANYPILDGEDPDYSTAKNNPSLTVENSSWLIFERLSFKNSSDASIYLGNSHYITLRRLLMDYHKYGVLIKSNTSHLLMEYCDITQSFADNLTWSQLKGSKWEGGALTSFGGAGMNVIRNNYFHHMFNAIYFYSDSATASYFDANVWIYDNKFEYIVDDTYEPESYAFNNHFFNNTLINTHRMVSLAPPGGQRLGPIFIYKNYMYLNTDPTKEAVSGRTNSSLKLNLSANNFPNGVYYFNNTVDATSSSLNFEGVDLLNNTVNQLYHFNNIYNLSGNILTSNMSLVSGKFNNDMSNHKVGFAEDVSYENANIMFQNAGVDGMLKTGSSTINKSVKVTVPYGFANLEVISAGSDLGAFDGNVSSPVYVTPSKGEAPNFPANKDWPSDIYGNNIIPPTVQPTARSTAVPTAVPTIRPTAVPTIRPTSVPTAVPTDTPIRATIAPVPQATAQRSFSESNPKKVSIWSKYRTRIFWENLRKSFRFSFRFNRE